MIPMLAVLLLPAVQIAPRSARPLPIEPRVEAFGSATPGSLGLPRLSLIGLPSVGRPFALQVQNARPSSFGCLWIGVVDDPVFLPPYEAFLHPSPLVDESCFALDGLGGSPPLLARAAVHPSLVGRRLTTQALVADPVAAGGIAFTRAVGVRFGVGAGEPLGSPYLPGKPWAMSAADLDGDGHCDLAFLDPGLPFGNDTRLETLMGQGDGSFLPGISEMVGGTVASLASGDLDADGDFDLVAGDDDDEELNAFLGAGDGTFPVRRDTPVGTRVRGVELGALDGDAFQDAVVLDFVGSRIHVLRGLGDGSFALSATHAFFGRPAAVAIEDFDADGALDLLVGVDEAVVIFFRGVGDGSFQPHVTFPVASPASEGVLAGDFDADGDLDAAVHSAGTFAGSPTTLSFLPGRGDGTFDEGVELTNVDRPGGFARGDFDRDGIDDFAVAGGDHTTQVWRGSPAGPVFASLAPGLFSADDLVCGDFGGDGALDLAVGSVNDAGGMVAIAGHGDGTFGSYAPAFGATVSSLAIGLLDGDPLEDLVLIDRDEVVHVLRGLGALGFEEIAFDQGLVAAQGPILDGLEVADLDRDGDDDLFVWGDGGLVVLLCDGAGGFTAGSTWPFQVTTPHVADLDGDFLLDLVLELGGSAGNLEILLGLGDGTFLPPSPFSLGVSIRSLAIADVDGDDVRDAVFGTSSDVRIALGLGDGSFAPPGAFPTPRPVTEIDVADLDQDGLQDLVLGLAAPVSTPELCVLRASAPGVFAGCSFPPDSYNASTVLEDLDRDGVPDIVIASNGLVRLLSGNGDATFSFAGDFAAVGASSSLRLRDLDGDLLPDALRSGSDGVFVQPNRTLR